MIEAQHPARGAGRARGDGGRVDPSCLSAINAMQVPFAVLDRSGVVLAVNAAWAQMPEVFDNTAACAPRENLLDWCAALENQIAGTALRIGLGRVLAGVEASYQQTCPVTAAGSGREVHIRIHRIGAVKPARYFVSQETTDSVPADVEARVLAAQIEERERLAVELHDSVGQSLLCLDLGLARLSQAFALDAEVSTTVADMAESLHQAHAEIRTLSFLLRPPWQEERGAFVKAMRDLVAGFARRSGLRAEVEVTGFPCGLGNARELTLFRVLQEALVNIHRHARAHIVEVVLLRRGCNVVLKVRDDGAGMASNEGSARNGGVGLMSMRSRLRQCGGDLHIVSGLDGTTLTAKLPL